MRLHDEIMNIQADKLEEYYFGSEGEAAYKKGHRDARHAAAELSLKYEAYIEKLEELANEFADNLVAGGVDLEAIKKECGL